MRKKMRFKWKEVEERSVYEIVSEDGVMRTNDILYIIRRLCLLLDDRNGKAQTGEREYIHPKRVIVNIDGDVRLADRSLPLSAMESYLPPEFDRSNPDTQEANVYALGMLMLFMASGKEKKTDIETVIGDRSLLSLIDRCIAFDPKKRMQNTSKLLEAIRRVAGSRKKILYVLLLLVIVGLLLGIFYILWERGRMRGSRAGESAGYSSGYAGGYEQGFADAPGIGLSGPSFDAENGNLYGNLGAESDTFAARSEDSAFVLLNDNIYKMDPYSKELKILVEDSGADSLHYYDGQLYYATDKNVLRIDPKTMREDVLCDSHTGQFYIFDNTLYLYDNATLYLYKIDPDDKKLTQLNGAMDYLSLQIVGEKLYYIAPDRGNSIYRCDLDGGNDMLVSSNSYESFCIYEEKLYAGTENGLTRMDLNGGNPERLTTLPARSPNVSDGGIFYVSGNDRTLEWLSFDGKMRYTVVSERTGSFNVAGQWIFYQNMDNDGKLWRVRVNGSDNARIEE